MAIFHFHAEIIKRSEGMSIVDMAARRSASILLDNRLDQVFNYHKKTIVVYSLIIAPSDVPYHLF